MQKDAIGLAKEKLFVEDLHGTLERAMEKHDRLFHFQFEILRPVRNAYA